MNNRHKGDDQSNDFTEPYSYAERGSADEPICNRSSNPYFGSILNSRLQRRQLMRGGIAAAVTLIFSRSNLNDLLIGSAEAATKNL